jgi:N utilization substance protein B
MQSAPDSRHLKRLERLTAIFSWQFFQDLGSEAAAQAEQEQFAPAAEIIEHVPELDTIILHYAPKHGLDTFNKMDLAILRQALYELLYTETPAAVVVDEAVEISKEYGSEETPNFVHGVLGNHIDDTRKATDVSPSTTDQ